MTFPNFPKRSSSDDDTLDQALNTWATGRHSEGSLRFSPTARPWRSEESPREALTSDALDFHRWADETRRAEPAATGPAAGTWNRVLRSTAQETNKGGDMSSAALSHEPQSAIVYDSRPYNRRELGRYMNLASTILIVSAVILAGVIAMMNLNQPSPPDSQFAVLGLQSDEPGNGVCDVDPLTVEQVVAIVENPDFALVLGVSATPDQKAGNAIGMSTPTSTGKSLLSYGFQENLSTVPDASTFFEVAPIAQESLDCILAGSVGQVWALSDPSMVQTQILRRFPVGHTADEVREVIESQIELPYWVQDSYSDIQGDMEVNINPDREFARIWIDEDDQDQQYIQMMNIGWQGTDEQGNVVFTDDWAGTTVEGDQDKSHHTSLIMVQREDTGQWYFRSLHGSA